MSTFGKSKNFRRRAGDDDNNDDASKPSPNLPKATTATPTSSSSSKPKPKKLLSFADDDEDAAAYVTPSSSSRKSTSHKQKPSSSSSSSSSRLANPTSSHKLTATKDRLPSSAITTTSNVLPQAGTYTKEALLELQKNTRTLVKPTKPPPSTFAEPKIVLKGLLKPPDASQPHQPPPPPPPPRHHRQEDEEEKDEESRDDVDRFASLELDSFIPDEDTIKKIRAKRERLRQSRAAAPDYISLDGGTHLGAAEGLSDEEPEFRTRIAMVGKKETNNCGVFEDVVNEDEEDHVRVHSMIANSVAKHAKGRIIVEDANGVGEDDEDEEDKIWEEEQFRKGLGKRMDDGSAATASNARTSNATNNSSIMHYPSQQKQQGSMMMYASSPGFGGPMGPHQGADALSIPEQAEVARKALQENIRRLKESHGRTISSLTKTNENLSSSLMNITALENSLSAAGEKFIFMQKLRDFVSVICEFLQHKAPFIEELEEQMQKLHEQRASAMLERRTADNNDEMEEVETAVKAAMLVLREHGSSEAASKAAHAALAALKEPSNAPVKLDEFGRDINLQKRMDMKRRAEARQRRKTRYDSKRLSSMEVDSSAQKIEGESSTDESDSESAAYQSNRDLLLLTADQIFSDASEEYSQLSVVKERFETWKEKYSTSYRDAYMSLSLPAIFSPYVRLELLKWDPLHENAHFFDMKWHSLLFDYGLADTRSESTLDDADANLIPGLVEKVAIPILHHAITTCWDMLSTRETSNVVSATSLVISYLPSTSSETLAELLVAIRTRLAGAVADAMIPTWSPNVLKAVPSAARIAAHRFGMSVRLMRNICLWKDILALAVLEKLALDELLCGKILPHLRSIATNVHDAVTRAERIIASVVGVWAGPNTTVDQSGKLQPLVDYILSLGRKLESSVTETETRSALARRLKKMLVELNNYDNARKIARTFNLKEAL